MATSTVSLSMLRPAQLIPHPMTSCMHSAGDAIANSEANAASNWGDAIANSQANAFGNGGDALANSEANAASNYGDAIANSEANAFGNGGDAEANSEANAFSNHGDAVANSVANAYGRRLNGHHGYHGITLLDGINGALAVAASFCIISSICKDVMGRVCADSHIAAL